MKNSTELAVRSTPPPLRPEQLAAGAAGAADAVREIFAEAAAANTTRSYASALRYWAAWFQVRYGQPIRMPVPAAAVVQLGFSRDTRKNAPQNSNNSFGAMT